MSAYVVETIYSCRVIFVQYSVDEMEVGDIIGIVIGCLCYIACTAGFIVLIMKLAKRKPGTVVHSQPTGPVTGT